MLSKGIIQTLNLPHSLHKCISRLLARFYFNAVHILPKLRLFFRAELEAAHGYHIQRAGIASFQDFIQKQEDSKDAPKGDFVLQVNPKLTYVK